MLNFSGDAFLEDGSTFFTEEYSTHFSTEGKPTDIKVYYKDPAGKVIAEIASDFSQSQEIPETHFVDHRDEYSYYFILDPNSQKIKSWVQEKSTSKKTEKTVSPEKNTYTFLSLIFYIRDHLSDLAAGKELDLYLFSPSKQETYSATLKKVESDKDSKAVKIRIRMSFFIRQFVPDVFLSFDPITKELQEYQGNANLLDEKNKTQKVKIKYKTIN